MSKTNPNKDMSRKTFLKFAATSTTVLLSKIIDWAITDRENDEKIKEFKQLLNALEGGRVLDIW